MLATNSQPRMYGCSPAWLNKCKVARIMPETAARAAASKLLFPSASFQFKVAEPAERWFRRDGWFIRSNDGILGPWRCPCRGPAPQLSCRNLEGKLEPGNPCPNVAKSVAGLGLYLRMTSPFPACGINEARGLSVKKAPQGRLGGI